MGKYVSKEQISKAKSLVDTNQMDEDQFREYVIAGTPYLWIESHLNSVENDGTPLRLRSYQKKALVECNSMCLRFGRQSGKTVTLVSKLIWEVFTESNITCLVYAPRKKHIADIMRYINIMIADSQGLSEYIIKKGTNTKNKAVEETDDALPRVTIANGSQIVFYHTQSKTAREQIRGSRGDRIFLEEAHYIDEEAIGAIAGVITSAKNVFLWAQSTPRGKEGWYFDFSHQADVEVFCRSKDSPDWSDKKEALARMLAPDEATYEREYNAQFVGDGSSAFSEGALDIAVSRAEYANGTVQYRNKQYMGMDEIKALPGSVYIGVDWNISSNGNKIIVMKNPITEPTALYYQELYSIENPKYTHITAVDKLFEIAKELDAKGIAIDKGYAGGTIDIISQKLEDKQYAHLASRLHIVDFGSIMHIPTDEFLVPSGTEYMESFELDPDEFIKRPMKAFMVSITAKMLLRGELIISPLDAIQEKTTLSGEFRKVKIERVSTSGYPVYSKKNLHKFAAAILSVYAFFIEGSNYEVYNEDGKQILHKKGYSNAIGNLWFPISTNNLSHHFARNLTERAHIGQSAEKNDNLRELVEETGTKNIKSPFLSLDKTSGSAYSWNSIIGPRGKGRRSI